jgi:hypothetical protein
MEIELTISSNIDQHIIWLISEARSDWISLDLIISAANESSDADPALNRLERTLVMVRRMLTLGFRAINMKKGGGSEPWPNQSPDFICQRVREEWFPSGLEDEGNAAFAIWFDLPDDRR